jgi:hypothetical protein
MSTYIIYFNQQWVGEHSSEWFQSRGPLARKVVAELKDAGALLFAGGLEEDIQEAIGVDEYGEFSGPISTNEFIGGLTIIEVQTEAEAEMWGAKIAIACGWPQEIRKIKS